MVTLHGQRVRGKYVLFQTRGDDWMVHRMDPPQDPGREPMPDTVLPMRARPGRLPKDESAYGFEILWQGVRAIALVEGGLTYRSAGWYGPGDRARSATFELEGTRVALRPLERRDAALLARWLGDPAVTREIDQREPVTEADVIPNEEYDRAIRQVAQPDASAVGRSS